MKKDIGIGIIGFGSMGRTHAYSYMSLPYFYDGLPYRPVLRAVCSGHIENARVAAETYGFEKYVASAEEVICDQAVDVVDICTPNNTHFEIARAAILAGKNVICEKPLCINAEEAEELMSLAATGGKTYGVVFNNRFISSVIRAKELIDSGRIGRILSFEFKYLHNSCIDPERFAGWKQDKSICGAGTLFDLGAHAFDLCRYLCGDFRSVYSREQICFDTHKTKDGELWRTNADEASYTVATMNNGAVGNIVVSKINVGENDGLTFEIYGTLGGLKFDLMEPNWLYFYDSTMNVEVRGYTRIECVGRYNGASFPSPKAPIGWLRGHIESMHEYLDAVYLGAEFSPSFFDGASIQEVLCAAHRSAERGKEIFIQ